MAARTLIRVITRSPELYADLGMYPFESVRWAWDELWSALHREAPWTPAELAWEDDAERSWRDPSCVVTHMCGWPIATRHRDDVDIVGTFELDVPEALPGGRYRSVILSRHDRALPDLIDVRSTAAVNSDDSLSGWLSLRAATVGADRRWPGAVVRTGAHVASLRALAEGRGDVTSVDAWSLALVRSETPELLHDLHQVGVGPVVPVPALVVRRSVPADRRAALRSAYTRALTDPVHADARAALKIAGPATVTAEDYDSIPGLVTS